MEKICKRTDKEVTSLEEVHSFWSVVKCSHGQGSCYFPIQAWKSGCNFLRISAVHGPILKSPVVLILQMKQEMFLEKLTMSKSSHPSRQWKFKVLIDNTFHLVTFQFILLHNRKIAGRSNCSVFTIPKIDCTATVIEWYLWMQFCFNFSIVFAMHYFFLVLLYASYYQLRAEPMGNHAK